MTKKLTMVHLQRFEESELLFDERETKEIFKFVFQADRLIIDDVAITNELRNLAQGLLIAAIDASYAMGWMEVIFRSTASPGAGLKKVIKKVATRGGRHWFKHLGNGQSLHDARIYESVRNQLARNFRSAFHLVMIAKVSGAKGRFAAGINCTEPSQHDKVWA